MLGVRPPTPPKETPAEKYQRIFNLYQELEAELVRLKNQGDKLVSEVHDAISKEAIKEKIASILNKN